jgi:hypothetical protein
VAMFHGVLIGVEYVMEKLIAGLNLSMNISVNSSSGMNAM